MALIEQQGHRLIVKGAMTTETVCALLAETLPLLKGNIEVDLGEVEEADSASIGLMFEWLRQAHAQQASMVYSNLPQILVSLSTLYGVLDLIPQRTASAH
ncbi:MAG TPA: STAS domain-containing protein [Novimethylophilus sp.]|jgi:phospholipid transport system transporter-binding protein|uniref:STAS domain-containing protein n=1 Tax=Novimethylophilus sp. TaxID=2137426 RepID=UPI002F3E284C